MQLNGEEAQEGRNQSRSNHFFFFFFKYLLILSETRQSTFPHQKEYSFSLDNVQRNTNHCTFE